MSAGKALDFEATEFLVRNHMHQAGARALEKIIGSVGRGVLAEPPVCGLKHPPVRMHSLGVRSKTLASTMGKVAFPRSAYQCPWCGTIRYPGDETLDVEGTGFSPGARRLMARAGADHSFAQGAADLELYAGMRVDAKDVERVAEEVGAQAAKWMDREASKARARPPDDRNPDTLCIQFDGTGAPMRPSELTRSRGKGPDGQARTREVKLACIFTHSTFDAEGNPVRDPGSDSYTGAIENSCDFGYRVLDEALRRGLLNARRVVALTDGAKYNRKIIAEHFPQAIRILDFAHAKGNLVKFICEACLLSTDSPLYAATYALLYQGRTSELLERMQAALPRSGPRRAIGKKAINYFRENEDAMKYEEFRAMGLFIGSGVIEAGCRTIVGQRLKCSGMHWTVRGANAIIALRCCLASGRFEDFWEDRSSGRAA